MKDPIKTGDNLQEKEHLADFVNFHELFRVRGKEKLYTLRAAPSPSGMCGMMEFMDFSNICVVHYRDLQSLGHFIFQTYAGHEDLSFRDVFRNLLDAEAEMPKFDKLSIKEQMEIAVPCFDEDHFKPSHMDKCLVWFREIIKKLDNGEYNQKENTE